MERKAEAALIQSEEIFRLIAENTSDGIIIFAQDSSVQYVSPSYIKQLGYSESEELSRNSADIYNLIHPDDRDRVFSSISAAIEGQQSEFCYCYRARHKDGHYIWREDNARFKYDDNKNYLAAYVVCRDVTERKLLEESLITIAENQLCSIGQDLHDNLGQKIAAIGYQVSVLENKLRHLGHSELLIDTQSLSAQIKDAVVQCKQVAQGLLPYELESRGLINSLQSLIANFNSHYPIHCEFFFSGDVKVIDPEKSINIFRITQEAANNAVRHAQATQLRISLIIQNNLISLSVSDDGVGFNKQDIMKTKANSGMGVKIMRHRASQIGGKLELVSNSMGGTTVSLEMRQ
ncbi:MAG: PAS domain S-box protein [Gallionellaceae bacterium]